AHDESAGSLAALVSENAFQPLALFVRSNLSAYAYMRNGRHEDQKASWQRDVARDAGTLLRDGLFGDLHQDFLAWLEQVADDRQVRGLHGAARRPSATVALALAGRSSASASAATAAFPALLGLTLPRRRTLDSKRLIFLVLFVIKGFFAFIVSILVFKLQLNL